MRGCEHEKGNRRHHQGQGQSAHLHNPGNARDAARTLDHPGHAAACRFRRTGRYFRHKRRERHGLKALANVEYEKAQPLLDELLACCARTDAGVEQRCTPDTVDGYIEDVRTLFKLRVEAAKLNFGFFGASPSDSPADLHIGKPRKPKG